MQIGGTTGDSNWRALSLVKFTKPGDINKEVTKATLKLHIAVYDRNKGEGTSQSPRASLAEIHSTGESDWDDTRLVYFSDNSEDYDSVFVSNANNAAYVGIESAIGEIGSDIIASLNLTKDSPENIEFDVTDYVKTCGGDYSFAITTGGSGAYGFSTKEDTTEANRPQLVIEYGDQDSTVEAPKPKHTVTVTAPGAEDGTLTTDRTKNLCE